VRRIAAAADVQLALLTYYFGTKEGLYRAVFQRRIEPISAARRQRLAAILARKKPAPQVSEVLDALARPWVELRQHRWGNDYTRLIAREVSDPAENRRGIVKDLLDPIAREFMAAMEQTLPRLPRARIHWAYHFFIGALLTLLLHPARPKRLSGELCRVDDNEAVLAEIIGFFTAALREQSRRRDKKTKSRRNAHEAGHLHA
jgi:AcrR family transcriptional regulator